MAEIEIFALDYQDNLVENYQKLAKLPGFVLLETSGKIGGRYDIVSAFPYNHFKIEREDSTQIFGQLPIPKHTSSHDLPFQGGAIGYFSYDLAARLAGIFSRPQPSLENLPLMHFGLYDWALISDHHLKKLSLVSANTRDETAGLVQEILAIWQKDKPKDEAFRVIQSFNPLMTKSEYQNGFNAIYQDLRNGRSYQVNYSQAFNAQYQGDSFAIYKKIRSNNPVPYSAFMRFPEADILSFSPERFLMMDQSKLLASPIKGTEKRSVYPPEDELLKSRLLHSIKNRAENVMIVDLLRNDLGKISKSGSVRVRDLCVAESYPAVHHLVSHIEAVCLEDKTAMDAFRACFPGGSITGAPKLEAMRIIAEQEAFDRGLYCGAIGYFSSHGRFDMSIAIRTIVACEQTLHMAAGGGIVIDSNWEEEYLECFTKIAAIINGLN